MSDVEQPEVTAEMIEQMKQIDATFGPANVAPIVEVDE